MFAIIARIGSREPRWPHRLELQPVVPRQIPLNACHNHPQPVYFDGPTCPCCKMLAESELTEPKS